MLQMGFSNKWRWWIKGCLNSSFSLVLVNGAPTLEFKIHKGLRQGDPLSSFLFILAAIALHLVLLEAHHKNIFRGIEVGKDKVPHSHLQFVDDALILGEWFIDNIQNLSRLFTCFYLALGLKVNFSKNKLFGVNMNNPMSISHHLF